MRNLSRVLAFKMGITTVLWFIPLLFFPTQVLGHLGFPDLGPLLFTKLLGIAYASFFAVERLLDRLPGRRSLGLARPMR